MVKKAQVSVHFTLILKIYITDLICNDEVTVEYCLAHDMLVDYMPKTKTCLKFKKFRNQLMNINWCIRLASRSVLTDM
eukprot:10673921-Ditylum_brightwellii.AAC.1